jgi:exosortase
MTAAARALAAPLPGSLLALAAAFTLAASPVVADLATGLWQTEDHSYAPMLVVVSAWLGWRRWREGDAVLPGSARGATTLLALALLAYALGLNLDNLTLSFGGLVLALAATLAWLSGWRTLYEFRYPLAVLAFATPLPGALVVALTFPLKLAVSQVTTELLRFAGFAIERQGVLIDIGAYRLLVADACSGLQSMFSLSAVAVVYLALAGPRKGWQAGVLLASVLPVVFAANVVRVVALALVTYWFGDAAGQGIIHDFSGILMFLVALGGVMAIDWLVTRRG